MIKDALAKLADGADLSAQEAETVMLEIMDGAATRLKWPPISWDSGKKVKQSLKSSVRSAPCDHERSESGSGRRSLSIPAERVGMGPIRLISPRPRHSWSQGPVLPWPNTGIAPSPLAPAARTC